jgi:hypothetical protein
MVKQPRDYVDPDEESFEDWLERGYNELSLIEKIIYNLQKNLPVTVLSCIFIGYLAGAYFGKFW